MKFDPEKLAVYRLARAHTRAVRALIERANTRGYSGLVAQLRDSATSITANILEGQGEWRLGKQAHYFYIAKGSTWESWGHTDSFVDFGLVSARGIAEVRDLQNQITALLITMIRNLEKRIAERRRLKRSSPSRTAALPSEQESLGEPEPNSKFELET